jgi:hypothetical protein
MQYSQLITQSDKFFWHGYIPFYEQFFKDRDFKSIAEIGVFKGNSVRWLMERFPNSKVLAGDILPVQDTWPQDTRVSYIQMDQSQAADVDTFFGNNSFDLIIDDGSHIPEHQVTSLVIGWNNLESGGVYILEDIHTNLGHDKGTAMSALMAIDHCLRTGLPFNFDKITKNNYMTAPDAANIVGSLKRVSFFRRTQLPLSCHNCGSTDFDYSQLLCSCGVDLFSATDSMTCVIEKI